MENEGVDSGRKENSEKRKGGKKLGERNGGKELRGKGRREEREI